MKNKIIEHLKEMGIYNQKLFDYAQYKLQNKMQKMDEKTSGLYVENQYGDIAGELITIKRPTMSLITVAFGGVWGVPISDFECFIKKLTKIEIGNIKTNFDFLNEYGEFLPLGYFSFLKKDKEFHYKMLAEWAKQGIMDNQKLIKIMKGYLSVDANWKWEFYNEIPKYLNEIYPNYIFNELSEVYSNKEFDKIAKNWGLDDLCKYSHPRKTEHAKLIYNIKIRL